MTITQLGDVVLGAALIGWIITRQLTWRPVVAARMWRMPVIVGAIGVFELTQVKDAHRISTLDVSVLLIELLISAGVGLAMAAIAVFRERTVQPGGTVRVLETRTGWVGLVLWLVLIAVRVGVDALATELGSVLATATGVILVMIAINRATRTAVILYRSQRRVPVSV